MATINLNLTFPRTTRPAAPRKLLRSSAVALLCAGAQFKVDGKMQAFGDPLPRATKESEDLSHLFPSVVRMAATDLTTHGLPATRALAVTSLAQAILADPAIFSRGASLEEARSNLAEAVRMVLEANRTLAEESLGGKDVIREPLRLPA